MSAAAKKDIARMQIDDIQFLHQSVEFIGGKTGKKWDAGK